MDTSKLSEFDSGLYVRFTSQYDMERNLSILAGIIMGIECDKQINNKEKEGLSDWTQKNILHQHKEPYASILSTINAALEDDVLTIEERDDIIWIIKQFSEKNGYFNAYTGYIQELLGILEGITLDKIINIHEANYLDKWLSKHKILKNCWPYDELESLLNKILMDKVITAEEHTELYSFCKGLSTNTKHNNDLLATLQQGYCQIDPEIIVQEMSFCFTGISKKYKRRELAEKIELMGGFVMSSVSARLNYLVVCDDKNTAWAYSAYGRKVEAAIQHRKNGSKIAIVHELDLYDHLID